MRSAPALILSLTIHGAVLALASLAGPWVLGHGVDAAEAAPAATFDGFHGNTVETEGLVEDEEATGTEKAAGATDTAAAEPEPGDAPRPKKTRAKKHGKVKRRAKDGDGDHGTAKTDSSGDAGDGGKRFGTREGGRGVKDLALAFTAAVPSAVSEDPVWRKLPLGDAGTMDVAFAVTDGKIVRSEVPDEAPAHLRNIVRRTLPLLLAGRYALGSEATGKERLRIAVTISQRAVEVVKDGPTVLHMSHDDEPGKPLRGYFTLSSGRHVQITVTVIP